jgi:16S rRNA (guanine527-N7)-methyltransferase
MTGKNLLISGAEELGCPLTDEQAKQLFLYLDELKKWNRKINLTAITGERDMVIKHLLDSLSYLQGFAAGPELRLLDMGSGAGFPAIPIKIVRPSLSVTLVDSVKKKASFLRHVVRLLQLKATEVMDMRTDELPGSYNGAFDIVTARAFADMPSALAAGVPLLKIGGMMVLSRGPEETIGELEMGKSNVCIEKKIEIVLPHSDHRRAVWVFRKNGN